MAGVIGSGACRDSATGPVSVAGPGPAFAASSAALAALGPGWRTTPEDPYGCFVSTASDGGPLAYRHRRVPLHFPAGLRGKDGAVAVFRYRLERPGGRALRVLNCVIPATPQAQRALAHRINAPRVTPDEEGVFVMSCPVDYCLDDPLNWGSCKGGAEWATWPECEQPEVDPCALGCEPSPGPAPGPINPFPIPPGEPGGGSSGGPTSCANCGPNAPIVACTVVTRGSHARCTVNVGDLDVQGWSFSDVGSGTNVSGPLGTAEWSGTAVRSGMVSVYAGGNVAQAGLTVEPRGWRWGQPGDWSFVRADEPVCYNQIPAPGIQMGWNRAPGRCDGTRRVQPDPGVPGLADGFTLATAASGPNAGMHYVANAHFEMNRRWGINPEVLPGGTPRALSGWQASKCGFQRNFYEFNACMGVDMGAFLAAIEAHEGMGTQGNNGHEGAARYIAVQPGYDPMAAVDSLVNFPDEDLTAFRTRVRTEIYRLGDAITDYASDDSGNIKGNWLGTYWVWDSWSREFVETKPHNM